MKPSLTIEIRPKAIYLLILLLISVNFLGIKVIGTIFSGTVGIVLFLVWLVVGHLLFKPRCYLMTVTWSRYYWPAVVFILGVLLSFIPARSIYGQGLVTSVFASRAVLGLVALPFIMAIRPKARDIESCVTWFSIILIIISLLDAAEIPLIERSLLISEEKINNWFDEDSFIHLFPGFMWVSVAFFFKLDRFRKSPTMANGLIAFIFIALVFLLQNRTSLFACVIIAAAMIMSMKSRNKARDILIKVLVIILVLAAVALTLPIWASLIQETTTQLNDDSYNRIKALMYFLGDGCHGTMGAVLGNGFISAKTSSIMQDLMKEGIYNSDVGLIGTWNYYGILPVIAVLASTLVCLFSRKCPAVLKCNAALILLGGITIAHFDSLDNFVWLSVFLYGFAVCMSEPGIKRK